jgi:hypothetical protein
MLPQGGINLKDARLGCNSYTTQNKSGRAPCPPASPAHIVQERKTYLFRFFVAFFFATFFLFFAATAAPPFG